MNGVLDARQQLPGARGNWLKLTQTWEIGISPRASPSFVRDLFREKLNLLVVLIICRRHPICNKVAPLSSTMGSTKEN